MTFSPFLPPIHHLFVFMSKRKTFYSPQSVFVQTLNFFLNFSHIKKFIPLNLSNEHRTWKQDKHLERLLLVTWVRRYHRRHCQTYVSICYEQVDYGVPSMPSIVNGLSHICYLNLRLYYWYSWNYF